MLFLVLKIYKGTSMMSNLKALFAAIVIFQIFTIQTNESYKINRFVECKDCK